MQDRPQGLLRQAQSWGQQGPRDSWGSDTHSGCSEWWARDGGEASGASPQAGDSGTWVREAEGNVDCRRHCGE